MTGTRPAEILRHLEPPGSDDRALVSRFATHNDQAAFAELVRRHGPLVWAACLRVAGHRQDAEDAFQAVFLVLVRKCAAIRDLDLLGNWLYGVAVRVAMKARRSAARRRAREVQVHAMPDPPSPAVEAAPDLAPVLDEELAALPAWYRDAVGLCDLRGVSREEAARLLGIPEGTLSSRLANGRKKLAARLASRGVALSVAAIPAALAGAARASVPAEVIAKACVWRTGRDFASRHSTGKWRHDDDDEVAPGRRERGAGRVAQSRDSARRDRDRRSRSRRGLTPPPGRKPDPTRRRRRSRTARRGCSSRETTASLRGARRLESGRQRDRLRRDPSAGRREGGGVWTMQLDVGLFEKQSARDVRPGAQRRRRRVHRTGATSSCSSEYDLVSGLHRLRHVSIMRDKDHPGQLVTGTTRTVSLDAGETHGYGFAADGKSFRTLAFTTAAGGGIHKIVVTSVDAESGKTLKTLLTAEGEFEGYGLSDRGERLAVWTAAGDVAMYDVDAGKSLWKQEKALKFPEVTSFKGRQHQLVFSPDARLLVVSGERARPLIFDAKSGEALPKLENIEYATSFTEPGCFSTDGRLLALHGPQQSIAKRQKAEPGVRAGGLGGRNPGHSCASGTRPPASC